MASCTESLQCPKFSLKAHQIITEGKSSAAISLTGANPSAVQWDRNLLEYCFQMFWIRFRNAQLGHLSWTRCWQASVPKCFTSSTISSVSVRRSSVWLSSYTSSLAKMEGGEWVTDKRTLHFHALIAVWLRVHPTLRIKLPLNYLVKVNIVPCCTRKVP